VNQVEIGFGADIDNIKLGVGVRLYFMNLLYHTLIFLLGFFLYSLYALITNANASSTPPPTATQSSPTADIGLGPKLQQF
jgi:hypothetical protein